MPTLDTDTIIQTHYTLNKGIIAFIVLWKPNNDHYNISNNVKIIKLLHFKHLRVAVLILLLFKTTNESNN